MEHPESAACNSTWTIIYQIASGHPLNDVWGLSEGDVGVVGWQSPLRPYEAVILNYDAFNWSVESGGPAATLEAITGNGLELLVVGSNGAVARRTTAGVWEVMSTPTLETLRDIWAAPGTGSVAVGDNGTILELMGSIWSPVTSPTNANLNGIWGTGGTTIWGTGGTTIAVGENGTILMGVGGVFTAIPSPTNTTLNGIWGTGGTTIWGTGGTTITVGDNGTVLNLVNGTFETVPTLSNVNLQAIWGTGGTTIAVGEAGTILMNNGGGWTISQQSLTTETLMGVWGTSPTNIFVVGDQGTILHYGPVVP
ncbi:MAG: hypothetical protein AUK47_22505 [Deltaproteobacteria bacterium CG2_30_63_29]|nr:MAG: hypothetical protein AUK47_22505 [Deltaproteobacteria bacterium CG2_30_63_29]PJB40871.1 MAG: hypothetical protein CO108_13975 [Deltaproteobacteria bacterium CG_4_9_14_3_um_filter_63_12]